MHPALSWTQNQSTDPCHLGRTRDVCNLSKGPGPLTPHPRVACALPLRNIFLPASSVHVFCLHSLVNQPSLVASSPSQASSFFPPSQAPTLLPEPEQQEKKNHPVCGEGSQIQQPSSPGPSGSPRLTAALLTCHTPQVLFPCHTLPLFSSLQGERPQAGLPWSPGLLRLPPRGWRTDWGSLASCHYPLQLSPSPLPATPQSFTDPGPPPGTQVSPFLEGKPVSATASLLPSQVPASPTLSWRQVSGKSLPRYPQPVAVQLWPPPATLAEAFPSTLLGGPLAAIPSSETPGPWASLPGCSHSSCESGLSGLSWLPGPAPLDTL